CRLTGGTVVQWRTHETKYASNESSWTRPAVLLTEYRSGPGHYQTDLHICRNIHACAVGKHATVGNPENEFAAPHLAHVSLIAHAFDFWRDMPSELHLADPSSAAFAR